MSHFRSSRSEGLDDYPNDNNHDDCNNSNNYSLEEILQLNEVQKILNERKFDGDLSEFESLSKLKIRGKEILSNIRNFVTYYFDNVSVKKLSLRKSIHPNIRTSMPRVNLLKKNAFVCDDESHERKYVVMALQMLEDDFSQLDVIIHLVYGGLLSLIEEAMEKVKRDPNIKNFFHESTKKTTAFTQTESITITPFDHKQIKSEDAFTQTESIELSYFDPLKVKPEDSAIQTQVDEIKNNKMKNHILSCPLNEAHSSKSSDAILENKLANKLYNIPSANSTQLPVTLYFSKEDPITKNEIITCSDTLLNVSLNESHQVPSEEFTNPFYVTPLPPEIKQHLSEGEVLKQITIPKEVFKVALERKYIRLPTKKYNKRKKKSNDTEKG